MIHFTVFGGTEAEISPAGFTALTVFGGAEFRQPTLAQRIVQRRREQGKTMSMWDRWLGRDRSLVITVFGGSEITAPTIMEEYASLRGLIESQAMSTEECQQWVEKITGGDDRGAEISRLTFFGACTYEAPTVKAERKALDAAEGAGIITAKTREELVQAIGCPSGTAASVVARAALA